ncbi:MAG: MBL fold metallo-hydrolase, partial [Thermoanaerobaculia bacterium]|nr:MBL fold metallo-hydrolase [Thermoanaerobaculia bacterium]
KLGAAASVAASWAWMAVLSAGGVAGQEVFETATHRFEEVAPGVHFVTGTGRVFVQSNCMVVVNEDDVLVVDSHVTPAAARALLSSIAELTDKPVRWLVNSHYHFDHAHGNQAFPDEVVIAGHEYTRRKLAGPVLEERTYASFSSALPGRIAAMKAELAETSDAAAGAALAEQIRVQEAHLKALGEVVPTPPEVTLTDSMTLYRGDRRIELHHLGRGHTGGDVVVFLPAERVVFTGDLLYSRPSYMGDGYVEDWPATLDRLRELDFDLILTGHGPALRGKEIIDRFQALLRELWSQTTELHDEGVSAEAAAERIDVAEEMAAYGIRGDRLVDLRAVVRMYELLSGEAE